MNLGPSNEPAGRAESPGPGPPASVRTLEPARPGRAPIWAACAAAALIALGAGLRLRVYLVHQSLWWDETMLADNVARRSYWQMLQPLDSNQTAPAAFLLLVKTSVLLFGLNEYAMHLVPLLAALAALPLFWLLAKRALPMRYALIALGLFAINRHLFGHSAEFKQYSSDVLVSVILLLLGVRACRDGLTARRAIWLAVAGAVGLWCSHPAVFVLGGVGLMLAFAAPVRRPRRRLWALAAVGAAWAASLALEYVLMLRPAVGSDYLERFWGFTFAPFLSPRYWADLLKNPVSLHRLLWFKQCLLHMFEYPGGFTQVGLAAVVFVLGLIGTWRRDRPLLAATAGPILLAVVASSFHLYPFFERLLMFAVPGMLLLLATGLRCAWAPLTRAGRRVPVGPLALIFLVLGPAGTAIETGVSPPGKGPAEIMPAMAFIRAHWRQGDVIYAHWAMAFTVRYYAEHTDHLPAGVAIVQSVRPAGETSAEYVQDVKRLAGRERVWVIAGNLADQRFLSAVFESLGKVRKRFQPPNGATALLVDLSGLAPPAPTTSAAPAAPRL